MLDSSEWEKSSMGKILLLHKMIFNQNITSYKMNMMIIMKSTQSKHNKISSMKKERVVKKSSE